MTQCDFYELVSAYTDDAVSSEEARTVEQHLFACARCRTSLRSLRELKATLVATPQLLEPQLRSNDVREPRACRDFGSTRLAVAAPVPRRLDFDLMAMADAFMAGTHETVTDTDAADEALPLVATWSHDLSVHNDLSLQCGENAENTDHVQRAFGNFGPNICGKDGLRQFIIAAAIALFAVAGMGFFAQRGAAGSLSAFDRHIPGLSSFGHAVMQNHMSNVDVPAPLRTRSPAELEEELFESMGTAVPLSTQHLGAPSAARVVEIDGVKVASAEYQVHTLRISSFTLPWRQGVELLELPPADAQTYHATHYGEGEPICEEVEAFECYDDGVGTAICLGTDGPRVRLWVATTSVEQLAGLVGIEHPLAR